MSNRFLTAVSMSAVVFAAFAASQASGAGLTLEPAMEPEVFPTQDAPPVDTGPFPARGMDERMDERMDDGTREPGRERFPVTDTPAITDPLDREGWQFEFSVGGWIYFPTGDFRSGDALVELSSTEVSTGDLDDTLNIAGTATFAAGRGPWLAMAELLYLKTQADDTASFLDLNNTGALIADDLDTKTDINHTGLDLLAGYRVFDDAAFGSDRLTIHAIGGVRITYLDTTTELRNALVTRDDSGQDELFADLVIGVKKRYKLSDNFALTGRADIGGFDITDGSDLTYNLLAGVEYSPTDNFFIDAGYRVFGMDFDTDPSAADGRNGDFEYDVIHHGPYVRAGFRF